MIVDDDVIRASSALATAGSKKIPAHERVGALASALWCLDKTAARRAAVEAALDVAHLADGSFREILADVVDAADDVVAAARRRAAWAVFRHAGDPAVAAAWRAADAAAAGSLHTAALHAAEAAAWSAADDDDPEWVAARDRVLERTIARIAPAVRARAAAAARALAAARRTEGP
jgi:hypothetical protein